MRNPKNSGTEKKEQLFLQKNFKIESLTTKNGQYSWTLNAYKEAIRKLLFNYNSIFEKIVVV